MIDVTTRGRLIKKLEIRVASVVNGPYIKMISVLHAFFAKAPVKTSKAHGSVIKP